MFRQAVLAIALATLAYAQSSSETQALQSAIERHQSGDYPAAIEGYRQFLKAHPEAAAVRSNLGVALAHEGRFAEAVNEYRLALDAGPANKAVRLNLALAYYKIAQIPEAVEQLEKLHPDASNQQALLLLATCYLREGQNKKVVALLEPFANPSNTDLAFAYLYGTALIRDNSTGRGQIWLDTILRKGDSAEARLLMGTAKLMASDFKGAQADLTRAVELNPKLPEAQAYLGLTLLRAGDTAGAAQAFGSELQLDPNDFDANLQLGGLMRQDGKFDEARRLLQRALDVRPGDFGARYQLAALDLSQGRMEEARKGLESLVKEAPQFVEAHVSLATVYYREKRKEDGDHEREVVRQLNAAQQAKQPGAQLQEQKTP